MSSNKHPVKNFHINYKGHYKLIIPFEFESLAYCFENGE